MDPFDYAWNEHERIAYIENSVVLPTKYKIKVQDNYLKRCDLEAALEKLPQKYLALWAMQNAKHFIQYVDIDDDEQKNLIVTKTLGIFTKRIDNEINAYELRNAGFLANTLAQKSTNDLSKFASRVFAQAIATGHMRGHAIVSSDYSIKVINLLFPNDDDAITKEREKQIELAAEITSQEQFVQ
jgi:hypothetical protein